MLKKILLVLLLFLSLLGLAVAQPPAIAPPANADTVLTPLPQPQVRAVLTHTVDLIEVTAVVQPRWELLPWLSLDGNDWVWVYAPVYQGTFVTFWRKGLEDLVINDGIYLLETGKSQSNTSRVYQLPQHTDGGVRVAVWVRNHRGLHVVLVDAPKAVYSVRPTYPWVGLKPRQRWRLPEP